MRVQDGVGSRCEPVAHAVGVGRVVGVVEDTRMVGVAGFASDRDGGVAVRCRGLEETVGSGAAGFAMLCGFAFGCPYVGGEDRSEGAKVGGPGSRQGLLCRARWYCDLSEGFSGAEVE